MVTIFALSAALLYGSADFLGGMATRLAKVTSVLPLSAGAGAAVVLAAALLSGEPFKSAGLGWGLAGGAVGGIGLIAFYDGLAAGPMSVVAPVSALAATVLPVGFALADGERATALVDVGALLCLAAIVLVSSADARNRTGAASSGLRARLAASGFHGRAVAYGLAAGTMFGLFFLS